VQIHFRMAAAIAAASIALCGASGAPFAAGTSLLAQQAEQPPPAPPEKAPSESTPGEAAKGTPATVLDDQQVVAILGKSVRSKNDEDMGRIVDVIVNRAGQVRAAVIDFGGFLGVGSRKVAVDWSALHFSPTGKPDRITLELTRNQVRVAPEYKPGEPVVVLGAPEAGAPMANSPAPASPSASNPPSTADK
jgi:hypothetical protein